MSLFCGIAGAIQPAAWGNINKYSQGEGNRWDEEIEAADFWMAFNARSFITWGENCSSLCVSISGQGIAHPASWLLTKDLYRGGTKRSLSWSLGQESIHVNKSSCMPVWKRKAVGKSWLLGHMGWLACHRGSPLSLQTKKLLSESKLTKQERFLFVLGLLRSGHVFAFKALPPVSLACTLLYLYSWYLQGQLSPSLSRVTGRLNIPFVSFNSKSTLLSLTSYIIWEKILFLFPVVISSPAVK